jgi:hypothetical protein
MQFIGASMYKSQFKPSNPYQSWSTIGSYSSESEAINNAQRKKAAGALMVRVVTANGNIVFSG